MELLSDTSTAAAMSNIAPTTSPQKNQGPVTAEDEDFNLGLFFDCEPELVATTQPVETKVDSTATA